MGLLAGSAGAEEVNHGYPVGIVGLKSGLVLCETALQVEEAFHNWKLAFELHGPAELPHGCFKTPADYKAIIEYAYAFENEHWAADILEFMVLKPRGPGIMVYDRTYYGYGSPKLKPGVLERLPEPIYH